MDLLELIGARSNGFVTVPKTPDNILGALEYAVLESLASKEFIDWATSQSVLSDLIAIPGKDFAALKQVEYETYRKYLPLFKEAQGN
jgi:hypothetical protein